MDEMDPDAIEQGAEMRKPVELTFSRSPVETVGPVPKQAAEIVEVCSLRPGGERRRVGPARPADARLEVIENLLSYGDSESLW